MKKNFGFATKTFYQSKPVNPNSDAISVKYGDTDSENEDSDSNESDNMCGFIPSTVEDHGDFNDRCNSSMTVSSVNSSVDDLNEYVSKDQWEWSCAPSDTEHDVYNDDSNKNDTRASSDTEHVYNDDSINSDIRAPSDTEHDVYSDDIFKSDEDISVDESDGGSLYKPSCDENSDEDSIDEDSIDDIPMSPKPQNTKKKFEGKI